MAVERTIGRTTSIFQSHLRLSRASRSRLLSAMLISSSRRRISDRRNPVVTSLENRLRLLGTFHADGVRARGCVRVPQSRISLKRVSLTSTPRYFYGSVPLARTTLDFSIPFFFRYRFCRGWRTATRAKKITCTVAGQSILAELVIYIYIYKNITRL